MANQEATSRKDRTGGDVTKAEQVPTPQGDKTKWEILNNTSGN